ncbi:hypothetical protein [Clostridium sp.]|uniref:hypothetical protein n=1 Tax=Clostridium sp. TaxID=1506 RepID=UPI003F3003E8
MGFVKSHNRKKKKVVTAGIIAGVGILVATGVGGVAYINVKNTEVIKEYEAEIESLQKEVARVVTYLPLSNLKYGTKLEKEMFEKVEIVSSVATDKYINEEDFGKYASTNLVQGVPVMKHMVSKDEIKDSTREEEFNMIYLPRNLQQGQYVDVRIRFPNGEDYIVLPKKKIQEVDKERNIIYCHLDAEEILRVSSGIVDAYLVKGAMLYTVTYVDGGQSPSQVTYIPNREVIDIIERDPNIIEKASNELARSLRESLDKRIEIMPEVVYEPITYNDVFVEYEEAQEDSNVSGESEVLPNDFY